MDATTLPKTPDGLRAAVVEAEHELHRLRFQTASGQLKRVRELRALSKRIAQLNTALTTASSV